MWEDRYATPDYVFGKAPAQFLVEHAAYLTPGATALFIADGEGRNAVYAAQHGMDVLAQDFAPSALAKARTLAAEKTVEINFEQSDIFTRDWDEDRFDLVAGIFIQFTGPDGRAEIFDGIKRTLKPGGTLLLHGYTPRQLDYGTGGPPFAENMYTEALLRAAFEGWDVLECRAYDRDVQEGRGHSGQSALIDFVARKPA